MPPSGSESRSASPSGEPDWELGDARSAVSARLAAWEQARAVPSIWARDPGFWPQAPPTDVAGRLGWLTAPADGLARLGELTTFATSVARDGYDHVVLFGMGGSSLASDVMGRSLPRSAGHPSLEILDSTHPTAVRACLARAPPERSLYIVSSKSGTTLEPNAFFETAWARAESADREPGRRFVAITDPGTPLERLAAEHHFRACFAAPPDVGGRYSALTVFGLVPAALIGVDLAGLLTGARSMADRCRSPSPVEENPGARLGAVLGELARAGHDKLLFLPSRSLSAIPAWTEQLVAESLGKIGRGIVPIGEPAPPAEFPRGRDTVYVRIALAGEEDPALERALGERAAAGAPVLRFELSSASELGAEFFRWEFAIAACGAVIEVNPFDQPDVEHAKELARQAMGAPRAAGSQRASYGVPASDGPRLRSALEPWLASVRSGDYVAVQAFLAPDPATGARLDRLVSALRRRLGVVVAVGYGPRFLHSTGQLHKGGPPSGAFLQIVDEPADDLAVPRLGLSFREIIRAQADGDRGALLENHRRLVVVNAGPDPVAGLDRLISGIDGSGPSDLPLENKS
jgi:transaldolase / glucose-6-phosphate isomerase